MSKPSGNAAAVSVNWASFQNNTAQSGDGGAIDTMDPLFVINSLFTNNEASGSYGSGGYGGAVNSNNGIQDPTLMIVQNSNFANNQASSDGGAINTLNSASIIYNTFINNAASRNGGAVSNDGTGTLDVTDSGFWQNKAGASGGAMVNVGTLNISLENGVNQGFGYAANDMFDGNTAQNNGGAIVSNTLSEGTIGALTIASSYTMSGIISPVAFYSNQALTGSGGAIQTADNTNISYAAFGQVGRSNSASINGGAINATGGTNGTQTLTVTFSNFTSNNAPGRGGAIATLANTDVETSYFGQNDNLTPGLSGGALDYVVNNLVQGQALQSSLNLQHDWFEQNYGIAGGAVRSGVVISSGQKVVTVQIAGCTFDMNKAASTGGALSLVQGTRQQASASATLINDTFFQNLATNMANSATGGAIWMNIVIGAGTTNTASLTSLTVFGNFADAGGGGLFLFRGRVSVANSIFDGNSTGIVGPGVPQDLAIAPGASLNDLGYNLVGSSDASMFTLETDIVDWINNPGLANMLAQNGAPAGYPPTLALANTSPGYENGDRSLVSTTDERGFVRGQKVSIGAEDPDATPP